MTLSGKKYALFMALISFILLFIAMPMPSWAKDNGETTVKSEARGIGDTFEGEELTYDMGFWIFRKIAIGRFTITREEDGTYKAVLSARTRGRFFRSTKSTFTAYIKESADKKRFITSRFEKHSEKRGTVKKILKEIDHENGILKITKWKNGKFRSAQEIEIPEGAIYDDPLAAFYNLRFGVYGALEKDGKYLITTFPEKGKEVKIKAHTANKKALKKGIRKRKNNATLLINARLDKELFDSSSGEVELFFDEKIIPVDVVAKDVLLFGDIYAKLRRDSGSETKKNEDKTKEDQ
jgi:hypothetical protein